MTITETTTVGDIASALPASVRVFQRHGIDFCCGGKMPIGDACRRHGVSFEDVARAIETASAGPAGRDANWTEAPLHALIDHIVATYHDKLREELPRIEAMSAKVTRVHGDKASYLARIYAIVCELSPDMRDHMHKEEAILFPAIRAIEGGQSVNISGPVMVMMQDHDRVGELLAELRTLTNAYSMPDWACGTFQALYHGLAELESDMHVHVHLENNVLFPRALATAGIA